MAKITKIERSVPAIKPRKKVAAYARVSMETERLNHSLSAQISYYSGLIQSNPDWEYAGVYADRFVSGTGTAKREEFNRMLSECENGMIDIILTKSISRFARNTVDLLQTVRHLKELGIEVRFEKENINSLSGDGELMLSILASFAQEEVRSLSDNVKWRVRKSFEQGKPNGYKRMLGYRWNGEKLIVVPEEAEVVRRIFQNFLDGKSRLETERELEAEGIRSVDGYVLRDSQLKQILKNVTYTGNLLLQKEYISDPIEKKRKKNHGELPQYWVENTHEPIIDLETFRYVQDEMARRKKLGALANKSLNISCFTGKIKCPYCGQSYMHNKRKPKNEYCRKIEFWACGSTKKAGGRCPISGTVNQDNLKKVLAEVLEMEDFDEEVFLKKVDVIYVPKKYTLEIHLADGRTVTRECLNTGHRDCWTEEYKSRVSEYRRNHAIHRDDCSALTTKIKCVECGCNFHKHTQHLAKGRTAAYWRCSARNRECSAPNLREDLLKQMICEVLRIDEFDDKVFLERISKIDVMPDSRLIFRFTDGNSATRKWGIPKRISPPWTEERRIRQMQTIKRKGRGSNCHSEK